GSAAEKRKSTTRAKFGARADATVPRVNSSARPSRMLRRGIRAAKIAIVGAPTTTPSAYAPITTPAWAIASSGDVDHALGSRSCAIWGSRPIATNSVEPMPNPPSASASSARRVRAGESDVEGADAVSVLTGFRVRSGRLHEGHDGPREEDEIEGVARAERDQHNRVEPQKLPVPVGVHRLREHADHERDHGGHPERRPVS